MKAIDTISIKENQKLFKKVGKKYVEHNDPYALDGLCPGWWLVNVEPGSKTIRACVNPARAEFAARARDMEDKLMNIIRDASTASPRGGQVISNEALKDWDMFIAKHGDEFSTLCYPSFFDNAQKIVNAITSDKI